MNIGVLGSTGFIGTHLVNELNKRGYRVTSLVREKINENDIRIGEISSFTGWQEVLKNIDCIIHCAGLSNYPKNRIRPTFLEYCNVNRVGMLRLLEGASLAGVKRIIYISSAKIIEAKKIRTAVDDLDPYILAKLEAEKNIVSEARKYGLEYIILRPPVVYGPKVKGNILFLLKFISLKLPIVNFGGDNLRSFIGVHNLVDCLIRCAILKNISGNIFYVSDDEEITLINIIKKISLNMGNNLYLLKMPSFVINMLEKVLNKKLKNATPSIMSQSRASKEILKWTPPYSMEYEIKLMVDWFIHSNKGAN
jgi:nucleoside-diphosphate-sugar epimerase